MTVSGQLTDVTDDHAVQAVLYDVRRNAEAADQLKSVFIATMSHEIRTPLGAVSGYAELLDRELSDYEAATGRPMPPQVREFLGAIRDKSGQLLHLVNELFDLSNMSGFSRASLSLHPSLLRVTDKIAVLLARKGVHLHLRLASDELFVLADRERLEQVLDHLLSNAVKFTEVGAVTLMTRRDGHEVVVELVDTGIGMSQAYMDRLFMPFTQEDNRLNRRFAGAGLGLALVKRLLDLMGGRVEVESEKGKGSTFRLFLPVAPAFA
jgi:signal transduction histidine kinase